MSFELLDTDRPASAVEEQLLESWRSERLFEQTLAARAGAPPWVFYDGPPTANGRPGVHHVFARTMKDLFCRYRAMKGFFVARKAGWDTHGLPVEIEVERELGISGKPDIEAFGVENFNRRCRESVWTYRAEWERMVERIAHWMDYAHPYVTYTNDYIESEWWALQTLHARGLLYRGHKILPYCARCGTALSSHEVAQGYEDVEDPSVYVALNLVPDGDTRTAASRRRLIVWTTTPWTLVSNVALAVHPDLAYVELRKRNAAADAWTIILAEARAEAVLGVGYTERWETVLRLSGADLVGRAYQRPLDWVGIPADAGRHEVIVPGEFVSAEDGSGIVHLAPAFGADDYAMGKQHGLAMLQPVTARGTFADEIPVVAGCWVKDADAKIIDALRSRDLLWKAGTLTHSYPHCWRCKTPLLYMARVSWFVRTSSYKDEMLARNARMSWFPPEVGEGRFGEWLKNNVDWAISRDRFWGTPLPIWVCEKDESHVVVVGSYAELATRTGAALPDDFDPHKPFVDACRWPCPQCAGVQPAPAMVRVSEVIDAWFDSGSMPFAQWHFPFENRDTVATQFPADFIAEGLDQTRGWFYSLLAIATGLGDALPNNSVATGKVAPYGAVVVNDLVLDATGVKMSKSRGNVIDPWDVIDEFGADAVRIYLVSSSQLGTPKLFDPTAIRDTAARFLLTLKNVYSGIFAQYANFGWNPSELDPPVADRPMIDRWVLSRAASLERNVDALLEAFDATAALRAIMTFVVDDLSNWYVRLSRARFFDVDRPDNRAAFATLHTALTVTTRLLAPFAPFLSDWIHRQLQGSSVHLADFVRSEPGPALTAIEDAMEEIRVLARLGRAAREDAGINVRRPLSRVLCVVPPERMLEVRALLPLLSSELNVKEVVLLTSANDLVTLEAKPNFRSLGKKFGKRTPEAAKAVEAIGGDSLRVFERGEPLSITVDGETRQLDGEDLTIVRRATGELVVKETLGRFAAIDPVVTPELRQEGLAREFVSRVQRSRKDAALAVSDRIRLAVDGPEELTQAVEKYRQWIAGEVLAIDISIGSEGRTDSFPISHTADIDGLTVRFALTPDY
ncbi:MAG: Isoleucine--tRNA ligase [Gemmatimonadaceae bacterium]|nr:Isoleucine--tRNA ligase [Gemmatimonadaceae bacterium]